ncbi:T9SS type A sorting domain-containing protein, partial [Pontibacter silvestris]
IAGSHLSPSQLSKSTVSSSMVVPEELFSEEEVNELTVYPNPFRDRAIVTFRLEQACEALLDVYDLQGRLVQRLFTGQVEAGKTYTFEFDGNNAANGMYISRLSYKGKTVSQKLLLIK